MDVSPHPEFDRILEAMKTCQGVAWGGVTYRSVVPQYAGSLQLIDGLGSQRFGARWNTKGEFRVVYASLDEMTAMRESTSHNRHYGIPVHQAFPRVFAAIEFQLNSVLMLNDTGVQSRLGVAAAQLAQEPWRELQERGQEALTQAIGRAAWTLRFEGLIVPSSENPAGLNVVVFNDFVPFDRMRILGS
ncbi:MAG: RES family NAD+ phosphorylase [Isosphaeraceae bacterium]